MLKSLVFNQLFASGIPAQQLLDPPQGGAAGPASQGAFGMQIGSELVNEGSRLWSALAETSLATASRFSRLVRDTGSLLCRQLALFIVAMIEHTEYLVRCT